MAKRGTRGPSLPLDVVGIGALNLDRIATRTRLQQLDRHSLAELRERFEHGSERPSRAEEVDSILSRSGAYFDYHLGGSAFNAIQALAALSPELRLGYVGVAGETGVDGYDFCRWLDDNNVDRRFVESSPSRSGLCVSYIADGERSLITFGGANTEFPKMVERREKELVEYLSRAKLVHITSLFDNESPELVAGLLAAAKQLNPCLEISFDPGHHWSQVPSKGIESLLSLTSVLFLNGREFALLGRGHFASKDDEMASRIFDMCSPRSLLIVLKRYDAITIFCRSPRRATLHYENETLALDSIEDATGAGDVFAAGLLFSFVFRWFELRHGIGLGLRLVHAKLKASGTAAFHSFPRILSEVTDELATEISQRGGFKPGTPTAGGAIGMSDGARAAVAARSELPDQHQSVLWDGKEVTFAPDFRSGLWDGQEMTFTPTQAGVISILWDALQKRTPELSQKHVLIKAGSDAKRIKDLFRDHKAWGTLIQQGATKGTVRLGRPARSAPRNPSDRHVPPGEP
jgi:sugar/nucleoside kinase (ribokinase family)